MQRASVLLVGSTEKSIALLQSLVPTGSFYDIEICSSGAEARRFTARGDYDVMVISAPLSDESGLELALEMVRQTISGVLLLIKADLAEAVATRVEDYGVWVISKPVAKPLFDQAMRFSLAMRQRVISLRDENVRLEKKLSELRIVDRAKCALIQYRGLTEEQAHRQIEKQAMDTRQTKAAVARTILSEYEAG